MWSCCRGSRDVSQRHLNSNDPLFTHVSFDMGDLSYPYIIPWIFQWTDRYPGMAALHQPGIITDQVVEGLILGCLIMILSGYYGPGIWTQKITSFVDWPEIFGDSSVIDYWTSIIFISFFIAHLPACVYNVFKARRAQGLPMAPVFREWTPLVIFITSVALWLDSPHSTLMRDNRLILFCVTMSFVFGRMTTKIILAHLTRQPFPYWTILLVPLVGGAVLGNLPWFGLPAVTAGVELWYLRSYLVFAMIVYFRWALLVINSICAYLEISCLTITKKPAPNQKLESEEEKIELNRWRVEKHTVNGFKSKKGDWHGLHFYEMRRMSGALDPFSSILPLRQTTLQKCCYIFPGASPSS